MQGFILDRGFRGLCPWLGGSVCVVQQRVCDGAKELISWWTNLRGEKHWKGPAIRQNLQEVCQHSLLSPSSPHLLTV